MWLSPTRLLSAVLLVTTSSALAARADAEADAQAWLERMAQAVRSLTYEGVFVYRYRGNMESMRILHRVHQGAEEERLFALTGSPREVIRSGNQVTCVLPDAGSVVVDRHRSRNPLVELAPMDVPALRQSYQFEVAGDGRVAGRDAVRIAIHPVDEYRYGYRLWVDRSSGLLLRADLVGSAGETVEQLMFTELHVRDSLPEAAFRRHVDGEGFTWLRDDAEPLPATGESRWEVAVLPPGFRLKGREWRGSEGGHVAEHHLYTDGLATVSVYIEPAEADGGFTGMSSVGAVNAFGRRINGHQAVVVGEVPAATVRMIGRGINRRAGQ